MGIESPKEGMDAMPFWIEGALWVYCVICDAEVKVDDSVPVSSNATFRACKQHYKRFPELKGSHGDS